MTASIAPSPFWSPTAGSQVILIDTIPARIVALVAATESDEELLYVAGEVLSAAVDNGYLRLLHVPKTDVKVTILMSSPLPLRAMDNHVEQHNHQIVHPNHVHQPEPDEVTEFVPYRILAVELLSADVVWGVA